MLEDCIILRWVEPLETRTSGDVGTLSHECENSEEKSWGLRTLEVALDRIDTVLQSVFSGSALLLLHCHCGVGLSESQRSGGCGPIYIESS